MIGIDALMANAFWRILIAEVTQRMKCVFCILVFFICLEFTINSLRLNFVSVLIGSYYGY
jgi:hypothetical protein